MEDIAEICNILRYYILVSTTKAGSGHVTSSLSAVELMAVLFYKYFRFDLSDPKFVNNDRLIFSKGHASPLFYSLYASAGKISEKEMLTLRKFTSVLEGHPTKRFKYTEVPTGSLGQGLSVGVGMALSAKMDNLNFLTYVLLGDGEIAEGQIWEALNIASHYKLNNLIGIIDVNRLGQSAETITGYDIKKIEERVKSFGWRTYIINDGHNLEEVNKAYEYVLRELPKDTSPYMIIAKTVKGKGVSFLEDREGWHGKALSEEGCKKALKELGEVKRTTKFKVHKPENTNLILHLKTSSFIKSDLVVKDGQNTTSVFHTPSMYQPGDNVATREAYGQALVEMGKLYGDIVVMDCDVSNSTFSEKFKQVFPDRYFEMFIAEQNMVSVALGISERGRVPYISTYGGFFVRTYDQVRMVNLAGNHIILCGSHGGVSVGQDGPSQMGLEDLAFFRSQFNTTVFYPSDATSSQKLTKLAYGQKGLVYIRTTRPKTPVIYKTDEVFEFGGSKTIKETDKDEVTVISAGITVYEALKAYKHLKNKGINIRVVDAYSIKPIDIKTILKASRETKALITVEDHYVTGGLGDAVLEVLAKEKSVPVHKLGVSKTPRSGKLEILLEYEGISAKGIIDKIEEILDINTSKDS